jgi:prepilin-type N-terminal cleavage/methylation domain-containing protein
MTVRGFTLVELLIALSLMLVITLAGFGFFGQAHSLFFKLKDAVDDSQDALSGLDKMRIDLIKAGEGLPYRAESGLPEGLSVDADILTIIRAQDDFGLARDIGPGDQRVDLESSEGLKAGSEICVVGPDGGEAAEVLRVEGNTLILGSSFGQGYGKESTRVSSLEKISYFLDAVDGVLRRRVGSGSAQPLIEDVESFLFSYDKPGNLVAVSFALASRKEKTYDLCLFPKNIRLAVGR